MSGTSDLDYEDIQPMLNPVQRSTLVEILTLTPAHKRVTLALAFAGITRDTWITLSGLNQGGNPNTSATAMHRWMTQVNALPLGAAVRLSAVFGVAPELLFSDHIRRGLEKRDRRQTKGTAR